MDRVETFAYPPTNPDEAHLTTKILRTEAPAWLMPFLTTYVNKDLGVSLFLFNRVALIVSRGSNGRYAATVTPLAKRRIRLLVGDWVVSFYVSFWGRILPVL